MNWGYKITLVIVAFIFAMLGMVFVAFKQTNEMMDANYYDKEIHYQELIDAAHNLNAISSDELLKVNTGDIIGTFPMASIGSFITGQIELIKQDDSKSDHMIPFAPNAEGKLNIPIDKFKKGYYKARIQWNNGGVKYYREQQILIL